MSYISDVSSSQPGSTSDRSVSSECVDYSGTSSYGGDESGAASDIDTYEESCFGLALDTSKHSHLHPEKLETIVLESAPPPAASTGPSGIFLSHGSSFVTCALLHR